jgi:hypothetical protein
MYILHNNKRRDLLPIAQLLVKDINVSGGGAEGEELFGVVWCGVVCGCRGVVRVGCGVLHLMSVERREKGVSGG